MKIDQRLKRLFAVLHDAVRDDPALAAKVEEALGIQEKRDTPPLTKVDTRHRRKPAAFDPFVEFSKSEEFLLAKLRQLDLEALKDIVAQFGMDSAKLVMKWKTPERVIDHIVATVRSRATRGDAFRN